MLYATRGLVMGSTAIGTAPSSFRDIVATLSTSGDSMTNWYADDNRVESAVRCRKIPRHRHCRLAKRLRAANCATHGYQLQFHDDRPV